MSEQTLDGGGTTYPCPYCKRLWSSAYRASRCHADMQLNRTNRDTLRLDDLTQQMADLLANQHQLEGVETKTTSDVAALNTAMAAQMQAMKDLQARGLKGATAVRAGVTTSALLAGGTMTADLVWSTPLPSTDYLVFASLDSSSVSVLGSILIQYPITNRTTTGCRVTLKNTALASLAGAVNVYALALTVT